LIFIQVGFANLSSKVDGHLRENQKGQSILTKGRYKFDQNLLNPSNPMYQKLKLLPIVPGFHTSPHKVHEVKVQQSANLCEVNCGKK